VKHSWLIFSAVSAVEMKNFAEIRAGSLSRLTASPLDFVLVVTPRGLVLCSSVSLLASYCIPNVSSKRSCTNTQHSGHTKIGAIAKNTDKATFDSNSVFFFALALSFTQAELSRSHFTSETLAIRVRLRAVSFFS